MHQYSNLIVEKMEGGVGFVQLNRPKALNALCNALYKDLNHALTDLDNDPEIGCIVLTGNEKTFSTGADVKEMMDSQYTEAEMIEMVSQWDLIDKIRKPIVAAINGFALGGGCEIAMMCDVLLAGKNAKFGQPEINLAIIPGMGGSQRLTKAIGKSRAMEMVLSGEMMDAEEAAARGLVSRVYPSETVVEEAVKMARKIASKSRPIAIMAKECVKKSFETSLEDGLKFESKVFQSTFATDDRKEGMTAFAEKRKPNWSHS